jgi:hypothetical protein
MSAVSGMCGLGGGLRMVRRVCVHETLEACMVRSTQVHKKMMVARPPPERRTPEQATTPPSERPGHADSTPRGADLALTRTSRQKR